MKNASKRMIAFLTTVFVCGVFLCSCAKSDVQIEKKHREKIPKISGSSTMLATDVETLKIKMGHYLHGPGDNWRSIAESNFLLQNMEGIECYWDLSADCELIGIKKDKIVFHGTYGLGGSHITVKDILPDSALTTAPAVYTIPEPSAGDEAYVWKLDNGYIALFVPTMNLEFYDRYVYNVAYVSDLTYFSYIE